MLDPISAREDSEVRRTVKHNLTVLDAGGDTQRRWVLVSLDQQSKKGFIPEQSSDNAPLDASVIPTDFKDTVRGFSRCFLGENDAFRTWKIQW